VLPGETDPSSINFPQQPLHPCLLPRAVRFKNNLHLSTNPYESTVGESSSGQLRVLGHSGKPLADIAQQTSPVACASEEAAAGSSAESMEVDTDAVKACTDSDPEAAARAGEHYLSMLERTVKWGNLCPTAPDSLPCYPLSEKDPFVLDLHSSQPDVVFSGNAPAYSSALFESKDKSHKTRLVCVPSFHLTRQAVLVNVKTLESHVLSFQ
jgi:DNA polymerase delta subunit 2